MTYVHTVIDTVVDNIGTTRTIISYPDISDLSRHLSELEDYDYLYGRRFIIEGVEYDGPELLSMIESYHLFDDHKGPLTVTQIIEPDEVL